MKIKKSLGQNFLNNKDILNRIVECGDIQEKDIIIEIGPGKGILTEKLIQNYSNLYLIEIDKDLLPFLKSKFPKLEKKILNIDFLKFTLDNFFKKKKEGFYIDVGCYHPYNNNNTRLFYERGWCGINIDLDYHSIDFFNFVRKRDENINIAISNDETEKDFYFFHNRSAINSLDSRRKKSKKSYRKFKKKYFKKK